MELKPADLGERWHVLLIRQRAFPPNVFRQLFPRPEAEQKNVRVGLLSRQWLSNVSGTEKAHKESLRVTQKATRGDVWAIGGVLGGTFAITTLMTLVQPQGAPPTIIPLTLTALATTYGMYLGPRKRLQKLHETPLKPTEVDYLYRTLRGEKLRPFPERLVSVVADQLGMTAEGGNGSENDELVRAYLALVREVLEAENLSERSQTDLKTTVKQMGEAMTVLPPPASVTNNSEETRLILQEAERVFARAQNERDKVVAASLARQAEALVQRASAGQNAEKISRRTRVLRQELLAQIETVRASLPTLSQGGAVQGQAAFGGFSHVAESVADVYREAAALADAHEELSQGSVRYPENEFASVIGSPYPTARAAAQRELDEDLQVLRGG